MVQVGHKQSSSNDAKFWYHEANVQNKKESKMKKTRRDESKNALGVSQRWRVREREGEVRRTGGAYGSRGGRSSGESNAQLPLAGQELKRCHSLSTRRSPMARQAPLCWGGQNPGRVAAAGVVGGKASRSWALSRTLAVSRTDAEVTAPPGSEGSFCLEDT